MPIQFTCPHCGLQTNVADHYAGRTGPCAGCGKPITVPPLWAAVGYAVPPKRSATPTWVILLVVCVGAFFAMGILVALLLPAVQAAREAARRSQCNSNLKQIGLALHNYHDRHGCFPPAYIADENGRPMHSWRVLLLPYLEQKPLYDQYNFDEPWDSPNNLALSYAMPTVYRCPSETPTGATETSYTMIVGPDTISDGPTANSFADIKDGSSNTILVIEAAQSGIHWLEPRDLDADQLSYRINEPVGGGIRSEHPGGVNVLMCDGAVVFLSEWTDPEEVKAMRSIGGGEASWDDPFGNPDWE